MPLSAPRNSAAEDTYRSHGDVARKSAGTFLSIHLSIVVLAGRVAWQSFLSE